MKDEDVKRRLRRALSCTRTLLLLSAALVFLACTPNSYAVSQTAVRLEPATCSASLNHTFIVNITVADVQNLYGLEVDVSWDASVLEIAVVEVKVGQADEVLCNPVYIVENSTTDSLYALAAVSMIPAPPFNGTGTAATITFRVKGQGNSSLSVSSQLYDFPPPDREPRISLPIEHDTLGSTFQETIPEISSLPLLAMLTATAISTAILSFAKYRSHYGGRSARGRLLMSGTSIRVAGD